MRSPGVIYRRYRQARKKILFDRISESKNQCHGNCVYGKVLYFKDDCGVERSIKMCTYSPLYDGNFDTCDNPVDCTAFANKWDKADIIKQVETELSEWEIKAKKYPELVILEWVLDKDYHEALKKPNIFSRVILRIINILEYMFKKASK